MDQVPTLLLLLWTLMYLSFRDSLVAPLPSSVECLGSKLELLQWQCIMGITYYIKPNKTLLCTIEKMLKVSIFS